jgi:hypothetical protein
LIEKKDCRTNIGKEKPSLPKGHANITKWWESSVVTSKVDYSNDL